MLIFDTHKLNLMKIILIGLLIFYALILITRYAAPLLLKLFLKKLSSKFEASHQNANPNPKNSEIPKNKIKKSKKVVGEYIDFEEID